MFTQCSLRGRPETGGGLRRQKLTGRVQGQASCTFLSRRAALHASPRCLLCSRPLSVWHALLVAVNERERERDERDSATITFRHFPFSSPHGYHRLALSLFSFFSFFSLIDTPCLFFPRSSFQLHGPTYNAAAGPDSYCLKRTFSFSVALFSFLSFFFSLSFVVSSFPFRHVHGADDESARDAAHIGTCSGCGRTRRAGRRTYSAV